MDADQAEAKSRNVLIVGAGQVGTFAAGSLQDSGYDVTSADLDLSPGYYARFGPSKGAAATLRLDVCEHESTKRVLGGRAWQSVLYCVGLMGAAVADDPERARRVNLGGIQSVASLAKAAGVSRFVYVSSFAVYGPSSASSLVETMPRQPSTLYGKLLCEAEDSLAALASPTFQVVALRLAGVFGPIRFGMGSHSARMFERLVHRAAAGMPSEIAAASSDGDEYIYIRDVAAAIVAAFRAPLARPFTAFNIGTGRLTSPADIATAITAAVPKAVVRIIPADAPPRRRVPLNVESSQAELGFRAHYDLDSGLRNYIATLNL